MIFDTADVTCGRCAKYCLIVTLSSIMWVRSGCKKKQSWGCVNISKSSFVFFLRCLIIHFWLYCCINFVLMYLRPCKLAYCFLSPVHSWSGLLLALEWPVNHEMFLSFFWLNLISGLHAVMYFKLYSKFLCATLYIASTFHRKLCVCSTLAEINMFHESRLWTQI